MNTTLQSASVDNLLTDQVLTDNLKYLMTLSAQGTQPEAARSGLRTLQQQYPDFQLDLLWEREAYDHSLHYDTLLKLPGQGTVSLSFCPEKVMPWPMRGVHRWHEEDLVRVNQAIFTVGQAIACLDFMWDEARIVNHLVNMCLIQEELDQRPIEVTSTDLQLASNRFRKMRKLYRAEDTHRWLAANGMTHAQLERLLSDEVKVAKLREQVAAPDVDGYFASHQANFRTISWASLRFLDQADAVHAYQRIHDASASFYEVAASCAKLDGSRRPLLPEFEITQPHQGHPVLEILGNLDLEPGRVLEPFAVEELYRIVQIIDIKPACLDEPTREAIQQILFDQWLAQRREVAQIEWYWGSALQTAA